MSQRSELEEFLNVSCAIIAMFAIYIGLAFVFSAFAYAARVPKVPEVMQLKIQDISLMTENEKALARAHGIATYRVNGMYYVDASLPSEYWER